MLMKNKMLLFPVYLNVESARKRCVHITHFKQNQEMKVKLYSSPVKIVGTNGRLDNQIKSIADSIESTAYRLCLRLRCTLHDVRYIFFH